MKSSEPDKPRAVLCLHDVAPGQAAAVRKILDDLQAVPVPAVSLALVPAFHQTGSWERNPEGVEMIRSARAEFRAEILLHGYYHQRVGTNKDLPSRNRFRSKLQSADEDEFYGLDLREAEGRIGKGLSVLAAVFQSRPAGFIPPSWVLGKDLTGVLRGLGFSYTEDHFHIIDIRSGHRIRSPLMAFATRSALRRGLSLIWSWGVFQLAARKRILRVALHPADYQSPGIRSFALEMIKKVNAEYEWCLYRDLFSA
jgi:predicted deacetylase